MDRLLDDFTCILVKETSLDKMEDRVLRRLGLQLENQKPRTKLLSTPTPEIVACEDFIHMKIVPN